MGLILLFILFTDPLLAQWGGVGAGQLEGKLKGLTDSLIAVILPAVSILGIIYAAILAATGDQSAKPRMVMALIASVIGFLAPVIISWLKSVSGV